ncbi:MAG TPA: hypothetical protein VMJ10_14535 [Kofleriaceae bacterium]|nr:hypothetical protein [Kofleriaceae bacterium]
MPDDRPVPEAVRAVWQHLGEAWDDPARHDAFVALVAEHGCYAWAAARYRERAGDPIADRQLARLKDVAVDRLLPPSRAKKPKSLGVVRLFGVLAAAVVLTLVLGFLYLSTCDSGSHQPVPPPRANWTR